MRLPGWGRLDRTRPLRFGLDGRDYAGLAGDTLASALVAAGVDVVGSSVRYARPRGLLAAGVDEPNALVQVGTGAASEPSLPATTVELYDGLVAESLAGLGRVSLDPDPAGYDGRHAHVDVLVVGGGPTGLAAALAAGRSGARVLLVDDGPELGGRLLADLDERIDGVPALAWVASAVAELAGRPEVRVLTRSTALGVYDAGYVLVAERRTDHLGPAAPAGTSRQRLWHVRAGRIVLAAGAHERPIVFADNDRPGTMLASAARSYLNRWAALPGRRAVVFTTNDSAYATAVDLSDGGVEVAAVVDARPEVSGPRAGLVRELGIPVVAGAAVVGTTGSPRLAGVEVCPLDGGDRPNGQPTRYDVDLLAVSGGWSPTVHLFGQVQGPLRYDAERICFVPAGPIPGMSVAGAARGRFGLADCLADGFAAGSAAARLTGFDADAGDPPSADAVPEQPSRALWLVPGRSGTPADWTTHFVDLQRDATVADIVRAVGAGMRSVEHVKRATTIGTGNDQGKTSGVNAVGVLATLTGRTVGATGVTTYRPPYVPVAFGLLAGADRGALHDPVRVTPMHGWHVAAGAVFEDVGQWKRPWYYPRPGEDLERAVLRECAAVRTGVGVMDATTLGKIDIQGPDAAEFLGRIYTNAFGKLAVGACRYGLMCTADGMVFDDGVVQRLADDRFVATTTTGGAAKVLDSMEEWLQTEWPQLRVRLTSVTEQWATVALVGPRARDVLAELTDLPVDNASFPFMAIREGTVAGLVTRVCRISFSGELAYELNVASWYGRAMWEAVLAAGAPYGITPYGTETMHVLRAEKGFVIVGQDTDGTVTPQDLGMDWIVSKVKSDFVGRRSQRRSDTVRTDRKHLVGLLPDDPGELLPEGAQLVLPEQVAVPAPTPMVGHVTSSYRSATLGRTFALALVKGGRQRIGDRLVAPLVDRAVSATVTKPVFYDEEGTRRDG